MLLNESPFLPPKQKHNVFSFPPPVEIDPLATGDSSHHFECQSLFILKNEVSGEESICDPFLLFPGSIPARLFLYKSFFSKDTILDSASNKPAFVVTGVPVRIFNSFVGCCLSIEIFRTQIRLLPICLTTSIIHLILFS